MKNILAAPLRMIFVVGWPITYVLNVVVKWESSASFAVKLLLILTLDAVLAFIWPMTWVLWIVRHLSGSETPLSTVLGFSPRSDSTFIFPGVIAAHASVLMPTRFTADTVKPIRKPTHRADVTPTAESGTGGPTQAISPDRTINAAPGENLERSAD